MRTNSGFTILELVIVMGLVVLMSAAIADLYFNFNTFYGYQNTLVATGSSAGRIVNETETLTYQADQVLASHTFTTGTYTSSSTVLVLELPSIDSSGEVIASTYDYAVVYLSGTSVYRRTEANAASSRTSGTEDLGDNVNSFTLTYDNGTYALVSKVTIDVITQSSVRTTTVQDHLNDTLYLRNH